MEKISYQKIALKTLLQVLLMIVVFFILNSWPSIKQSFNGNIPPLNYWLDHSFKLSNIITIIVVSSYFFYKNTIHQKELVERRNTAAKYNNYTDIE